jgi:hypothetical protein
VILELLEYLTTDCPAYARRLGYLGEAIAIKARHRRHCEAWGPHLARSRAVINAAAEGCVQRRTALVLGSGLLLDIPLGALAAAFERVLLVDVVHLRAARRTAARYSNVALVTGDLTGIAADLAAQLRAGWRGTPVPAPALYRDDASIDLVVSANIAAQLAVIPAAALRRAGADDGTIGDFCAALVRAHLDYLAGFAGRVCLITETERELHGPDGDIWRLEDALFGLALPDGGARWPWDLAPVGEVDDDYGIRNHVAGFDDFRGLVGTDPGGLTAV